MATASAKVTTEEIVDLNIQLKGKEIDAMIHLLGKISGLPEGPRGVFDKIWKALEAAGANPALRCTESPTGSKFAFPNTWEEFNSIPYTQFNLF